MTRFSINTLRSTGLIGILALVWAGCSNNPENARVDNSSGLDAFFSDKRPADSVTVIQARNTAKPGDVVHISGQIGGASSPFAEGFAAFVIADESLTFCSENPADSCGTPWDACCETPEKISASRAMVQFTDAEGNPVASGLKGRKGLAELDHVVVTGVINPQSTAENLIIDGQSLYLAGSE